MINIWFISDTHFGHKNILEYEKEARPFENLEEMHETMIDRWNSVVKPKDNIYHLGDFAFGKHNIEIASKLNGRKILIMGNHDCYPAEEYLKYFDKLYGTIFYKKCILSHVPIHLDQIGSRCILNIHGHLHSSLVMSDQIVLTEHENFPNQRLFTRLEDKSYFNVSCEQNNLTPIHWDIINDRIKELII